MQNLDRRLATLERVAATDNRIDVIIRKIVSPGHLGAEIHRMTAAGGDRQWQRLADESERDFQDRAIREVHRNAKGFAVMVAWPGETSSEVIHAVN